jgi:hypothetical protein
MERHLHLKGKRSAVLGIGDNGSSVINQYQLRNIGTCHSQVEERKKYVLFIK